MASFTESIDRVRMRLNINYQLKEEQLDVLRHLCEKKDKSLRHTFVLFPTGFGKSILFGMAPILMDSMYPELHHKCVVVMPLKTLIQDQVQRWRALKISCFSLSDADMDDLKDIKEGSWTHLFATPEALQMKKGKDILQLFRKKISFFALDEVHCLVDWGTSFRPNYKSVASVSAILRETSILMLTATATEKMQKEIIDTLFLSMEDVTWFSKVPDRPNIEIEIVQGKASPSSLEWYFERLKREGIRCPKSIVFVRSRRDMLDVFDVATDHLGEAFWATSGGAPGDCLVEMFYGQLDDHSALAIPTAYKAADSSCRCIIATIAFGLGMQVDDVEFVFHWGPSGNVLQYWQEVGRAGRDGRQASAIMYLPPYSTDERRVDEEMTKLIGSQSCLRLQVLSCLKARGMTDEDIAKCCGGARCCMYCQREESNE